MPDLRRLLFDSLFASQADLARAIVAIDDSPYDNERALASFISQVVTGSKRCPKILRDLIVAAAEGSAQTSGDPQHRADLEALRIELIESDEGAQVEQLLHRQARAEMVVIVRGEPNEVRRHPRAGDFQRVMCEALLNDASATRYLFVMDVTDDRAIDEQWESTLAAFSEAAEVDSPAERLAELNEAGRIRVLGVEPHICSVPVVAFDPHLRGGWCDVYFWDWIVEDGRAQDSILKFSSELRSRWVHGFFRGFLETQTETENERKFSASKSNST